MGEKLGSRVDSSRDEKDFHCRILGEGSTCSALRKINGCSAIISNLVWPQYLMNSFFHSVPLPICKRGKLGTILTSCFFYIEEKPFWTTFRDISSLYLTRLSSACFGSLAFSFSHWHFVFIRGDERWPQQAHHSHRRPHHRHLHRHSHRRRRRAPT